MTADDRQWLEDLADALDKARRYTHVDMTGVQVVTVSLSDELAQSVADRLRAIASAA